MEALRIFLYKHSEHKLKFVPEWYADCFDGYKEIDADDYMLNK